MVGLFLMKFCQLPTVQEGMAAYRQTYHAMVSNNLAAKTLREKCVSEDLMKMIGHLEEIWETLDIWYKRPEKYMAEALKPILEFRRVQNFIPSLEQLLKGKSSGTYWHPHK